MMTGDWEAVGNSIKALRDEHGWTQQELSERSGVSLATIRNTERALGRRTRRTLEDLSRALRVPEGYLSDILTGHASHSPCSVGSSPAPAGQRPHTKPPARTAIVHPARHRKHRALRARWLRAAP
jgi:DNA-binding XRE family transcriptional regulator